MATFAFNFVVEADPKLADVQIEDVVETHDDDDNECDEPRAKKARNVKENDKAVSQDTKLETTENVEPSDKDKQSECQVRPHEELSWDDMLEECLHDTEIESIDCSNPRDKTRQIQLFSLNPSLIETRILSLSDVDGSSANDSISEAATKGSDLVPRVYEGGLKIWECSIDLVRFLDEKIEKLFSEKGAVGRLKVLELGCGAGLPGIWALRHAGVDRVDFQDYNRQVVLGFTMPNVVVNERDDDRKNEDDDKEKEDAEKVKDTENVEEEEEDDAQKQKDQDAGKVKEKSEKKNIDDAENYRNSCRFHCGDWSEMVKKVDDKFDLVLASETIYSLEDLRKFHDAVVHFLRPEGGVALVAAKEYYFGVGGGVDAYLEVVEKSEKTLKSKVNWIKQHGVRRAVIELRY